MWNDQDRPGRIGWMDLTVEDAPGVRDFYSAVAAWQPSEVPMEGYSDFAMSVAGTEDGLTGICHRRGQNAAIPAQWIPYIVVADLAAAAAEAANRGAELLVPPSDAEGGGYAIVRGLAGEVFGLWQDAPAS